MYSFLNIIERIDITLHNQSCNYWREYRSRYEKDSILCIILFYYTRQNKIFINTSARIK